MAIEGAPHFGFTVEQLAALPTVYRGDLFKGQVAVVTGAGEGLGEWFEPGVHLEAPERGQPEAIAEALERLIVDRAHRERLAAAGRARVLEFATPERVGETLARVIEETA